MNRTSMMSPEDVATITALKQIVDDKNKPASERREAFKHIQEVRGDETSLAEVPDDDLSELAYYLCPRESMRYWAKLVLSVGRPEEVHGYDLKTARRLLAEKRAEMQTLSIVVNETLPRQKRIQACFDILESLSPKSIIKSYTPEELFAKVKPASATKQSYVNGHWIEVPVQRPPESFTDVFESSPYC